MLILNFNTVTLFFFSLIFAYIKPSSSRIYFLFFFGGNKKVVSSETLGLGILFYFRTNDGVLGCISQKNTSFTSLSAFNVFFSILLGLMIWLLLPNHLRSWHLFPVGISLSSPPKHWSSTASLGVPWVSPQELAPSLPLTIPLLPVSLHDQAISIFPF